MRFIVIWLIQKNSRPMDLNCGYEMVGIGQWGVTGPEEDA